MGILTRRSPSLRKLLAHAVLRAVVGTWAIGGAVVALTATGPQPVAERPPVTGSYVDLIARHGCWQGQPPADMAGRIPGHVVATTQSGRTVWSSRLVGPALEQTFGGRGAGLTVHAFCR